MRCFFRPAPSWEQEEWFAERLASAPSGRSTSGMMVPRRLSLSMTAAIISLVLLPACTGAHRPGRLSGKPVPATTTTVPGISPHSIVVGTHQPITGSGAPGGDEVSPATAAFFSYVNARGGVFGRTIVDKVADDASGPSQASDAIRHLVLDEGVFAILNGLGTATHAAVEAFLNAEKVPDLFAGSGCTCWNNPSFPWTTGWQPDYTIEGKVLGTFVTQYLKAHSAVTRVAYVYENDTLGNQGVSGLDQEIDPSTVATRQSYQSATGSIADATPVVSSLESSGAQVVVVFADAQLTAITLEAAADASYHPLFVVDSAGSDPNTLTALLSTYGAGGRSAYGPGASPQTIETGIVSDAYLPVPADTSNPWIGLFKRIHDEYIPNLDFDTNVIYGMAVGYTFYALLEAAGPDPTRSGVMATLGTANLDGPGLTPFAFSPSSHQGMTGAQIVTDSAGVLEPSGPVYVTGDRGGVSAYTGTSPGPPPSLSTS